MRHFAILNVGLDRALLCRDRRTEAQTRQLLYARSLPARLLHIVKAPFGTSRDPVHLGKDVCVVPCPVRHWSQFVPAAIRLSRDILARESVDLVQVQEPFVSGVIGISVARRFRLPLVVGLYSDEIDNPIWLAERRLNLIANSVGKWVLRRAAACRSDSAAVVQRLSHYGFRNLTHVPFLITHADRLSVPDKTADNIRLQLLGAFPGPLLLAVCRLEEEKNIPLMLSAFADAVKRHQGLVLAIAGDGSLAQELSRETERIGPGRVRWLGRLQNTEIAAYYQAADLVLLSSNRESAARVLCESLLAATPVLTTDTAGAREVVDDKVTGRVVPVGDVRAYTEALISLCSAPETLAAMGLEGRQRLVSRMSADTVVSGLRRLYEKALEHPQ